MQCLQLTRGEPPQQVNYVPYIQSSGAQWIDSEVLVTPENMSKLRVVADIEIIPVSGSWAVSGIGGAFPYVYIGVSNGGYIAVGRGTIDQITKASYVQGRHTWDYDLATKTITVSDLLDATAISLNTSGSTSQNFYISAYNNGSGAVCHKEKNWGYKFYLEGTLIRDLRPCYDPDGVACLYDKMEKKYYYNQGTGEFTTDEGEGETTITFTVNGTTYTAEEGMTWAQFVSSSYNTNGFNIQNTINGPLVYSGGNTIKYNGTAVKPTDAILANAAYTTL